MRCDNTSGHQAVVILRCSEHNAVRVNLARHAATPAPPPSGSPVQRAPPGAGIKPSAVLLIGRPQLVTRTHSQDVRGGA